MNTGEKQCPDCGGPEIECFGERAYSPETLLVYPLSICPACHPDHPLLLRTDPLACGVPYDHPYLRKDHRDQPSWFSDLLEKFPGVAQALRDCGYMTPSAPDQESGAS
jgi:hypothetical protein